MVILSSGGSDFMVDFSVDIDGNPLRYAENTEILEGDMTISGAGVFSSARPKYLSKGGRHRVLPPLDFNGCYRYVSRSRSLLPTSIRIVRDERTDERERGRKKLAKTRYKIGFYAML